MAVGQSVQLTATCTNALGEEIPSPDLRWNSGNNSVLWATARGKVTGVSVGAAEVTVEDTGSEERQRVTVTPP